jgi:hypothetical protein
MTEMKYDNLASTISNIVDNEISIMDSVTDRVTKNLKPMDIETVKITVFGNDLKVISPKKMGSLLTFFYIKEQPLITIGPQCKNDLNIVNYCLILFLIFLLIEVFLQFLLFPQINILYNYIGIIIYLSQLITQFYTALINAGIPDKNNYLSSGVMKTLELGSIYDKSLEDKYLICHHCNILTKMKKDPFHCPDCNICVEG